MHVLAFEGAFAGRERLTNRFVVPGEKFVGGHVDIEPGQPGRLMRGRFEAADHATEINPRRMRTETAANPVANVRNRFDVKPSLFTNLANDGLHSHLPDLECPPRQLPAKEITPNRKQELPRGAISKDHGLGDHERPRFADARGYESPPGDRRVNLESAPESPCTTAFPDGCASPARSDRHIRRHR